MTHTVFDKIYHSENPKLACNREFLQHISFSLSFSWKFCASPPPFLFIFVSIYACVCVFFFPDTCCKSVLLSRLPLCHMICTPRHETTDHSNLHFGKKRALPSSSCYDLIALFTVIHFSKRV